jgi:limonene-1,2-epoxide hydrolase
VTVWPTPHGGHGSIALVDSDLVGLVRQHVAAFNAGDIDRLLRGLTPGVVWHTGVDVFDGVGEVETLLREAQELLPSLEILEVVAEADRAACEMLERYRHNGVDHVDAIAVFFRFSGELITRVKVYREGSADP